MCRAEAARCRPHAAVSGRMRFTPAALLCDTRARVRGADFVLSSGLDVRRKAQSRPEVLEEFLRAADFESCVVQVMDCTGIGLHGWANVQWQACEQRSVSMRHTVYELFCDNVL